jgi:hypothetical protein
MLSIFSGDAMDQTDWKASIAALRLIHEEIEHADKRRLYPRHLPETEATREQIEDTELKLNCRLPSDFAQFLLHADGWTNFVQDNRLFGTTDLRDGRWYDLGIERIAAIEAFALHDAGVVPDEGVVIAASEHDIDVFWMALSSKSLSAGTIVWFAGGEVERYASFTEFFLAQVEYDRQWRDDFRKQAQSRTRWWQRWMR